MSTPDTPRPQERPTSHPERPTAHSERSASHLQRPTSQPGAPGHPGARRSHPHADAPSLRLMRLALHGAFYVLLAIGLAPAAAVALGSDGSRNPYVLIPGAVLAVVYGLGVVQESRAGREAEGGSGGRRPLGSRTGLWLAAVTALWLVLLLMDRGFSYVVFPLFFLFLHVMPVRWSLPAVAATTGAVVAVQSLGPGGFTAAKVIGPVAGAAVAVLTAYGYAALYRESRNRQHLIDDLVRTRDELAATQREAGRLAERQRLAREIHDTLAQGLSSIVLLARAAETAAAAASSAPSAGEAGETSEAGEVGAAGEASEAGEVAGIGGAADLRTARAHLREIGRTASDNLAEARRFVRALTPPALEDATLPEALRRLTAGFTAGPAGAAAEAGVVEEAGHAGRARQTGTEVRFHLDGEPRRLPVEAEVALLRLTQEALANVARHARAGRAAVTLAFLDGQVTLDVYDDGVGFTPGGSAEGEGGGAGRTTFGLHGMRERIAELGGTLTVESAPGEGTAVAAALPVRAGETRTEARTEEARTEARTDARTGEARMEARTGEAPTDAHTEEPPTDAHTHPHPHPQTEPRPEAAAA
ncbi:sensor histidine kinase [Streptomyces sp. NPDC050617]|uniref:sensor histidine kinase n=1 Tax=Streptomyces sp. NPDC050617 TaxID=3154628 RepID=UPI00344334BA